MIEQEHPTENQQLSQNPLLLAREQGTGFICFHTHKLNDQDVEESIRARKSIEVDIEQVGPWMGDYPEKVVYGHHPWAYLGSQQRVPTAEEFQDPAHILNRVTGTDTFVKFDIKSQLVLPWVARQAKRLPPQRRMLHAFVSDLHAINIPEMVKNPYSQEQGHTVTEYVPLQQLKALKIQLEGIPIQVSARGFSLEDLVQKKDGKLPIIDFLCNTAQGVAEVINLNISDPIPPEIIQYMWDKHHMMTELNIDRGEIAPASIPFLGRSDEMTNCTPVVSLNN